MCSKKAAKAEQTTSDHEWNNEFKMSINVANPWLKVARQKSPPYLAECDQDIKLADFYNLHIELLPQPYFGNVISAKVVCLLLNPGYSRTEDIVELDCRKLQQALRDNLDSTTS